MKNCDIRKVKTNMKNSFTFWVKQQIFIPYFLRNAIIDWVFPANRLKRLFGINRCDIVKCADERLSFSDTRERILHANMNLLCQFVEKNNDTVNILDNEYKYVSYLPFGEIENSENEFINLNQDKSIKDEIFEIYNWWKRDRKKLLLENDYFLKVWFYLQREEKNGNKISYSEFKNSSYFVPTLIYKYMTEEKFKKLFDSKNLRAIEIIEISDKIEEHIDFKDKEMLTKLIDIREFIWE